MRHDGYFRHLLVRKAVKTEEILIDIVTASEEGFDSKPKEFLDKWAAALQALESPERLSEFSIRRMTVSQIL